MKNINFKEYLELQTNKVLKIKYKNIDNFIYGRLVSAGGLYPPTSQPSNQNFANGTLNKINDFDEFNKDRTLYKNYSLIGINANEIESIEILTVWQPVSPENIEKKDKTSDNIG